MRWMRCPLKQDKPQSKPSRVILSERMRVEALRSAGGAKPSHHRWRRDLVRIIAYLSFCYFSLPKKEILRLRYASLRMTGRGIPITTHFAIRQNFTSIETSLCHKAKLHLRSKLHPFRRSLTRLRRERGKARRAFIL